MKKILYLILCCMQIFISCKTIRYYKEVSSNEYLQKVSTIRYKDVSNQEKPILLNGFYKLSRENKDMVPGYERIFVFYEDGTCARLLVNIENIQDGRIDLTKALKRSKSLSNGSGFWGVYKIENDTLSANLYRRDLFGLDMGRLYFRIKDERTIICFREDDPQQVYDGEIASWSANEECQFVEAYNIPMPRDKFLKKKKWYWENESDWEEYMLKRKKKKNSK